MIDVQGGWVIAYFRENQLGNMAEGDPAEVVLDVLTGPGMAGAGGVVLRRH